MSVRPRAGAPRPANRLSRVLQAGWQAGLATKDEHTGVAGGAAGAGGAGSSSSLSSVAEGDEKLGRVRDTYTLVWQILNKMKDKSKGAIKDDEELATLKKAVEKMLKELGDPGSATRYLNEKINESEERFRLLQNTREDLEKSKEKFSRLYAIYNDYLLTVQEKWKKITEDLFDTETKAKEQGEQLKKQGELVEQLQAERQELDGKEAELKQLRDSLAELESKVALEAQLKVNAGGGEELQTLRSDLNQEQSRLREEMDYTNNLKAQIKQLIEEKEDLARKLKEMTSKKDDYKTLYESTEDDKKNLETQISRLESDRDY